MKYQRTTEPRPYDSVLFCGICGVEVHVSRSDDMFAAFNLEEAEQVCVNHLAEKHRFRFWLWENSGSRTGRPARWLLGGLV